MLQQKAFLIRVDFQGFYRPNTFWVTSENMTLSKDKLQITYFHNQSDFIMDQEAAGIKEAQFLASN